MMLKIRLRLPVGRYSAGGINSRAPNSAAAVSAAVTTTRLDVRPQIR